MTSILSAGVASVIFSNGRDLLIGDLHGRSFRTLVQSQNRGVAVGVDVHFQLRRIFWTDTVQDKVGKNVKQNSTLESRRIQEQHMWITFHFSEEMLGLSFVFQQKQTLRWFYDNGHICKLCPSMNVSNKACYYTSLSWATLPIIRSGGQKPN